MKRLLLTFSIVIIMALNIAPVNVAAFQSPLDSDPKTSLFSTLPTPTPRSVRYRGVPPTPTKHDADLWFVGPFILRVIRMY